MKKIAFLGDEHKGEEILNVLQLLGGENSYKCHCNNKGCFYYIDDQLPLPKGRGLMNEQ